MTFGIAAKVTAASGVSRSRRRSVRLGAEPLPRVQCGSVGRVLDPGVGGDTGLGRLTRLVHPAPSPQRCHGAVPLLVGPAPVGLVFGPEFRLGPPDRRFDSGEAVGDQRRDVAVAAIFTHRGGDLPEPGQRVAGAGECQVRGADRAPGRLQERGGGLGQIHHLVEGFQIGVGEHPDQRRGGTGRSGGERGLRRGPGPHVRQRALHHRRREPVRGGDRDRRVHRPERRPPAGEVAAPVATQADLVVGRPGLGREIGDRMDRLEPSPHLPRDIGMHAPHTTSLFLDLRSGL